MANLTDPDESKPLTADYKAETDSARTSLETDSVSSIVLENLNGLPPRLSQPYKDKQYDLRGQASDVEGMSGVVGDSDKYLGHRPVDRKARKYLWIVCVLCAIGWGIAAILFLAGGGYKEAKAPRPHDPAATQTVRSGHKITMDQVLSGAWSARRHAIRWIAGPEGQDGLLLQRGGEAKGGYLVVDDVRSRHTKTASINRTILMSKPIFTVGSQTIFPSETWPNAKLRKVLVLSNKESNWRHSFTGNYWVFDVNTQHGEPLDPQNVNGRIQLAQWSPKGDAIAFVRDNNLYLRKLDDKKTVVQITKDGGPELFYGVPDWVYEEEVFSGNSATWWSGDGKYIAFLRTNETMVPTYPVQYFMSRPSGKQPNPGEENYPEVRNIKYPKAGAPNPIVEIQFYDVAQNKVFTVKIDGEFQDTDRVINEVFWAGTSGKVMFKETNRVSDHLKVVLVDAVRRTGRTVREKNIKDVDGGWFEVSEKTTYVPPSPRHGRPHAGYVDTVIHDGYDHLAYFTPLDNPEPVVLTSGNWEVVNAPSALDLKNNWVYFTATKESSIQRHSYRVKLDGSQLTAITDIKNEGYYSASYSSGTGFVLLDYHGPNVPWQKVMSVPGHSSSYAETIEDNAGLKDLASKHELPLLTYGTIKLAGFDLNYVERRPPHFNEKKRHPVLFWMYQGPGSQSVDKRFNIDFQAYVAASLGYIVVTVDGRGTGYKGRAVRCVTRGNIGFYESEDQIAAAKIWAAKKYVDESRMAIWGWSYGGFMTLKTLERDAGRTFKYGMAVAPVTDWRFYDSIYTERYMFTPQTNAAGYDNTSISDVKSLSQNVRFLVMHGVADDNVHTQSTYTLIDKLDVAGVENYDVHVFPDSDHGIYFHNANRIVYDKLQNWLINAFNGEWLRTEDPKPMIDLDIARRVKREVQLMIGK